MTISIINIIFTACCLTGMVIYFNRRERQLHRLAERKLEHFKDQYLHHVARRKVSERKEIDKLKSIARKLEEKHRKILEEKNENTNLNYEAEVEKIIKKAEEKAWQIEENAKRDMKKFIEDEKKEVRFKMVDLVMEVTKKVLTGGLTYLDHRALIEEALQEMEGEDEK